MHVAIIMDGNGRWAQARGRPRTAGHRAGADAVRRVVEAARRRGVRVLTLYAFSSDNWRRPAPEVRALLRLLERWLRTEVAACAAHGVRLEAIGRRDRLPPGARAALAAAERATEACDALRLRLAIDYSARDAILRAAAHAPCSREDFARRLHGGNDGSAPDVDLLIRSGGERRLSDFLLWECAYAELWFTDLPWPDFDADALDAALADYGRRRRRYGGLDAPDAPLAATAVAS